MIAREKIKEEIDKIPDYLLMDILSFISQIKTKKRVDKKLRTYKLKGKFDDLNIRTIAYE
jgi:hypothetical protein